jgi:iron complex outermembrane receptor protein
MNIRTRILCSASLLATLVAAPALAQTAQTQPAQDPGQEAATVDDVVVTGLRRSIQSAQTLKRDSAQIVDAIVAEDIGKLPDVTASESLARVTGVQVTRSAGEAADVTIRGLPNITTTYNGREIFTAEGRSVAIQDFPAGTVQALEVFKSGTANQVELGIGGEVNVRSRRPFDFSGREISGSLNGVYFEQADSTSWNGNLLLSDRWDTGQGEMGALINVAYTSLDFLDSTAEQSLDIDTSNPAQSPLPAFRFPNAVNMYLGQGRRWRPSANVAFQWRPSEELQIYADALYQGYRGRDGDVWNYNPLWAGTYTDVTLRPGTDQAQSLTAMQANRSDGYKAGLNRDTDTWQVGAGAVWTQGALTLSADVAHTESTVEDDQANLDYAFRAPTTVVANFDDDGVPTFDMPNYDSTDPNNVIYRGLFERRMEATGKDWQFRADADYEMSGGFITLLEAGFRYSDRDARREDANRYSGGEGLGLTMTDLDLDLEVLPAFAFEDVPYQGIILPTSDSIHDNIERLRGIAGFPGDAVQYPARPSLDANETSLAGYVQARYAFDTAIPIDGVVGLRAVRTETTVAGTQYTPTSTTDITRTAEYTDYLPNVSARLHFSEDLQLRLAFTQTRTRPNFDDLNPTYTIFPGTIAVDPTTGLPVRGANGGTVDLEPYSSNNYDASLEWYFSDTGSLTAAVFRREVEGFIDRETVRIPDPTDPTGLIDFNRPYNAGSNELSGYEISYTTFFDHEMLPDWASNFGLQANFTHVTDDGDRKLANLSENAANLVVLYETPMVSARLAYNYRSEFINYYAGNNGVPDPVMDQDRGQLDFSASFTPMQNLTIAFDAINITAEPLRRERVFNAAGDSYPWNVKYLERVYSLGIRFRY